MNENIEIATDKTETETTGLASRWSRVWASILDSLMMMAIMLPLMYFTGFFTLVSEGRQASMTYNLLVSLVSIAVFVAVNYKFLVNDGQTIGKKVLKIKIVDLTENVPSGIALFKRYGLYFGLGQIPVAGPFASIINILFIFTKEKRCGHDYFAGTKVINAL